MVYGYCRCSTNESKQDINRQIRELKNLGVEEENIYFEYESGTKVDRVQLNRLIEQVNEGDTLCTTEVSRITRSTKQLCHIIDLVRSKKLKLVIGSSMIVDCRTGELDPMTNAFLQIAGVFSELERNMISERVKSGVANARSKGKTLGRPKLEIENLPQDFIRYYPLYKAKQLNQIELARLCNCTRQSVAKYTKLYEGELQ